MLLSLSTRNPMQHIINNKYLLFILTIAGSLLFSCIGKDSLSEYDESRNGMNAYEMYHNGDYVNLYYAGELDTWNAKPPLVIWLTVANYKIFGFNEFALRFVAAISTILFFYVLFRLVELLDTPLTAFITCLILLSCKAIIGWHIGLNGDFDATLTLFLILSAYSFYRYTEKGAHNQILLTGLYTGLAFYTKGPAGLVFLPGFVLYALCTGKLSRYLKDYKLYVSLGIVILIIASWFILVIRYGKTTANSYYGSKNSLETMLVYDTVHRLTSTDFEVPEKFESDNLFFFHSLDVRMNVWNYLFYLALLTGIILIYKNRKNLSGYIRSNEPVLFALCVITPLTLVVNFATNKHDWYLAPVWGFIAFLIAKCTVYLSNRWKPAYAIHGLLFAFLFIRHLAYLQSLPKGMATVLKKSNALLANTNYVVASATPQNILLNLTWMNMGFNRIDVTTELKQHRGQILLIEKNKIDNNVSRQIECNQYFDDWCLAKIK